MSQYYFKLGFYFLWRRLLLCCCYIIFVDLIRLICKESNMCLISENMFEKSIFLKHIRFLSFIFLQCVREVPALFLWSSLSCHDPNFGKCTVRLIDIALEGPLHVQTTSFWHSVAALSGIIQEVWKRCH